MTFLRRWKHLFLAIGLLGLSACGATGSVPGPGDGEIAPPAPPTEIPSFLAFPSGIGIDINELSSDTSTSESAPLAQVTSAQLRDALGISVGTIEESNGLLSVLLRPLNQFEIPVAPDRTNFTATVKQEGLEFELKYDFSAFDFDGDGSTDDCTGCTCPTGCTGDGLTECPSEAPETDLKDICFRVWIDGARYSAGVFSRIPTTGAPGAGSFRAELILENADQQGSLTGIVYDHTDPQALTTEINFFLRDIPDGQIDFSSSRKTITSQLGPIDTALKQVQISLEDIRETSPGELLFISEFKVDTDFASVGLTTSGTFNLLFGELGDDVTIFPPVCAQISTAIQVADGLCSDLGLDASALGFLNFASFDEVELPPLSEFPATPSF